MTEKKYTAKEEMRYHLQQNTTAIENQMKRIEQMMANVQQVVHNTCWHAYDATIWIDGHAAEEVTKMASLLQRQQTLVDALGMVERQEEEAGDAR